MNLRILFRSFGMVILLSISGICRAQITYHESHEIQSFNLIRSSENLVFTFNVVAKTFDKFEFTFYSLDGKKLNRIELQNRKGVTFLGSNDIGLNTVLYIDGPNGYEALLIDKAGQEIARKSFGLEDKIRDISFLANDQGLRVVYEIKRKKVGVGIVVEQCDASLTQGWKFERFREDGKMFYGGAALSESGELTFLFQKGNTSEFGLCVLSAAGQEQAFADIDKNKLDGFSPYFLRYNTEKEVIMISNYGSTSSETFKGYPLGMSIKKFNSTDGSEIASTVLSFVEVQELVGDKKEDNTPVYTIGPALRVMDLKNIGGADKLICESFTWTERKQVTPSTTAGMAPTETNFRQMRLMDFYVLNLNAPKEKIHRIWKPTHILEFDAGFSASASLLSGILKRNSLFSYQGVQGDNLLIRGYGQMHSYYNLVPLTASFENTATRVYFGRPINGEAGAMPPYHSFYNVSTYSSAPGLTNTGFIRSGDSFMLFNIEGGQLQFSKLKFN